MEKIREKGLQLKPICSPLIKTVSQSC